MLAFLEVLLTSPPSIALIPVFITHFQHSIGKVKLSSALLPIIKEPANQFPQNELTSAKITNNLIIIFTLMVESSPNYLPR